MKTFGPEIPLHILHTFNTGHYIHDEAKSITATIFFAVSGISKRNFSDVFRNPVRT